MCLFPSAQLSFRHLLQGHASQGRLTTCLHLIVADRFQNASGAPGQQRGPPRMALPLDSVEFTTRAGGLTRDHRCGAAILRDARARRGHGARSEQTRRIGPVERWRGKTNGRSFVECCRKWGQPRPAKIAARASRRGIVSKACGLGRRLTARGSNRIEHDEPL